ncbi:MAG: Fe-S protein assembly co-chaperone HscB [Candidatus Dasytiphilus stammeri]
MDIDVRNLSTNYFEIFRLPVGFDIDEKLLATRFYELQQKFHPDHWINKSATEKKFFLERCALINKAWQVLRKSFSRSEYLLSLYGFNICNEQSCTDIRLLKEQLELREECEKVEQELNEVRLNNFVRKIDNLISTFTIQIEKEMGSQQWKSAVNTLQKLKFLNKLRHHLDELENRFFDF